jgi:hypothetical protein
MQKELNSAAGEEAIGVNSAAGVPVSAANESAMDFAPLSECAGALGGIDPEQSNELRSLINANGAGVVHMSELLVRLCRVMRCEFRLDGQPLDPHVVMSTNGFLPALAWLAQDLGRVLLQADFGCVLKRTPAADSLFGARCIVPPTTAHIADVIRMFFFVHCTVEVFGMREGAVIEVQPLFEAMSPIFSDQITASNAHVEGEVPWPQTYRAS